MNHIRVSRYKFVNPDRFDSISFAGLPDKPTVTFARTKGAIQISGDDAMRLWYRLCLDGDALDESASKVRDLDRLGGSMAAGTGHLGDLDETA